jgi:tetratricopeptide (TPR) repeat protein
MNDKSGPETVSIAEALTHARRLLSSHPQQAADQARAIIQAEPGIAEAYLLLAIALRISGDLEEAQIAEKQSIGLARGDPVIVRAQDQITAGKYKAADDLLSLYLTDTPNDAVAIHLRAQVQLGLGQTEEAERLFRRSLALAPSYEVARRDLDALMTQPGRDSSPSSKKVGRDPEVPTSLDEEPWFTSKWGSDSVDGPDGPNER